MGIFSSSIPPPPDKHIVIVGAGYGGAHLGLELLQLDANFTIINSTEVFHNNPAMVRAVVVPGWSEKIMIPLEKTFGDHFKLGHVTGIKPDIKQIQLQSGEQLKYDLLVIATGARGVWPYKIADMSKEQATRGYAHIVNKVMASEKVVIIGGGATGVEIAAEVAAHYPEKEVTLIHSSEQLVGQRFTPNFQRKLKITLDLLGVKLVLGAKALNLDELDVESGGLVKTDRGQTIEADFIFKCLGASPNSDPYKDGLEESTDQKGALRVNQYLQVDGHEDIYAIGDCTNVSEPKTALIVIEHVKLLTKTIPLVLNGRPAVKYTPDNAKAEIALSLGHSYGLGQVKGGWVLPSFLIYWLKSRHLLTDKLWAAFRQPYPSTEPNNTTRGTV